MEPELMMIDEEACPSNHPCDLFDTLLEHSENCDQPRSKEASVEKKDTSP